MHRIPWLLALLLLPGIARAGGPGTHIREANRALDLLVQVDPAWAADAATPLARAYLAAGSMSPDLQNPVVGASFGHSKLLSYRLLDAAATLDPARRLFALGHLCHQATDHSIESFVTPTLFGSHRIGMIDLSNKGEDAKGESEGLLETVGDLRWGDWNGLVDAMYDLWFDGSGARQNLDEVMTWYCEEGKAFVGKPVDCAALVASFEAKFATPEALLAGASRDEAKDFVQSVVNQPIPALLDLMGSELAASLAGEASIARSPRFATEVERAKAGPLGTEAFWNLYDERMADLGPSMALAYLADRPVAPWPTSAGPAVIHGNLQSMMQYLPNLFAVVPGLLVDQMTWSDEAGRALTSVETAADGQTLRAKVLLYVALPFSGTVRGVVRADAPGLDDGGPGLGEASLDLQVDDPSVFATSPRVEFVVPFRADTDGAVGFTLDLFAGAEDRPFFTSRFDRLWGIELLEMDDRLYRDNFGTYRHWPPSLPVSDAVAGNGALLAKVRIAPGGPGIAGATVRLPGHAPQATTGQNGLALFDVLSPGPWTASATAAGYRDSPGHDAAVAPGEERWVDIPLHAIPVVTVDQRTAPSAMCAFVTVDPAPFGGQASAFLLRAYVEDHVTPAGPEAEAAVVGVGTVCLDAIPDGSTPIVVRARARYLDGTEGMDGFGPPVAWDRAAPLILDGAWTTSDDAPSCVSEVPYDPPGVVTVSVRQPRLALTRVEARVGERDWTDVPSDVLTPPGEDGAPWTLRIRFDGRPSSPDGTIAVRVTNALGIAAETGPIAVATWGAEHLCQDPDPGAPDSAAPEVPPETDCDVPFQDADASDQSVTKDDVVPGDPGTIDESTDGDPLSTDDASPRDLSATDGASPGELPATDATALPDHPASDLAADPATLDPAASDSGPPDADPAQPAPPEASRDSTPGAGCSSGGGRARPPVPLLLLALAAIALRGARRRAG